MKPEVTRNGFPERMHSADSGEASPRRRSKSAQLLLVICAILAFSVFFSLGVWQVKRLQWKLDLIERVEHRVHAPAANAPSRGRWLQINAASDEYRHVHLTGVYLYQHSVRVQASTDLGAGFWLLTPLQGADGNLVLVNRGFVPSVPPPRAIANVGNVTASKTQDVSTVAGLMRMSEPGGGFLRHNDPIHHRWYSRDVQAIAASQGLSDVAPYFVDADANSEIMDNDPAGSEFGHPVGGLTVISFPNNHLVYAITWFALAFMVAGAYWWVARDDRKLSRSIANNVD